MMYIQIVELPQVSKHFNFRYSSYALANIV